MKIPIVGFARGFTGENSRVSLFESLERRFMALLSGVVCVSEAQRRQFEERGVRAKQWWVVHNAVTCPQQADSLSLKNLRRNFGIPEDGALIVSAGRLSPEKGHKDLLQAISMIHNRVHSDRFLICGDGPCRKSLEEDAKKLGISDRVLFPGFRRDIMEIFKIMDLLVLPSYTEGLPNVILEAFSCSKPVVATRVGGVPEVVQDGRNGFLVPPKRPEMLAEAITKCLASPNRMELMGKEGKALVLSKFNFEEQISQLEFVYAQVLYPSQTRLDRI